MKSKLLLLLALSFSGAFAQTSTQGSEPEANRQAPVPSESQPQAQRVFPIDQTVWWMKDGFLPDDFKTAGLNITFVDSPKLTGNIEATLQAAGFNIQPADTAAYVYQIEGVLTMQGKVQAKNVSVGKIMEIGLVNSTNGAIDWGTVAGDAGIAATLSNAALQSGLMNQIAASGNVVDALLRATGLSGKFNEMLVGDRRGICLFSCTYWNHSAQSMHLVMKRLKINPEERKPYQQVSVGIYDDKLWPAELTNVSLLQLYRMMGVPDIPRATNPEGVKIEYPSDIEKVAKLFLPKK